MARLRKALVISVMFVTVLSMSVVVAPNAGATASAGDLIKMSGLSSVYYLAADGKRYVFPNESTYFSWYGDFSSVVTIPQSELESYPLGKNVTMRAGAKLVKITTDPKVYAVEPNGNLKWVPSETVASTLYGSTWAKRVVDVPDAFFTNYTVAAGQVSATAYPTGSLVKFGTAADVFYINADGTASKIATEAAFSANRFSWNDVITATIAAPTAGADIAGAVATLTDTSAGAGGTAGAGTGLTVALSGGTPASASIISDSTANEYPQALISFTTVNFTAAADGDVKVTSVKLTRTGISSDSDLGNLYLYDGATRLAEYTSFSSKIVTFSNSAGLFTVAKGTSKSITLKGDLARGSTSVSSGKTIGFDITATADVVAEGAAISGSFPVAGNLMSTATVSDLGHLYFAGLSGVNGTYPTSVKADEANKELWSVNVTADSQNMQIKYLKFTMVGTIATTDIKNIKLKVAGEQVGDAVSIAVDNTVTWDLSAAPIAITSGQTKAISLTGDMMGGSGRTFKFTIQRSSDVSLYDTNYGVYVTPSITNAQAAFGIVQPVTTTGTAIDAGTLTLGVATDSPTGNIADGGTGLTLAKFSFYAAGEAVKVDNLVVKCATTTGGTFILKNVKLMLDGSQVGTTDTSLTCDNGTDTTTYTFGNTFVVPAATTRYLTVVADTTDGTVDAADTVKVSLNAGSGNASGQTTLTSLSTTAQEARTLTVASGTASVVENTSFSDRAAANPSGTVSASGVQIASFIITSGAGEAIDVTQIVLADDATTQVGDNFQNLMLKNDGTQIGSTVSSPNTTAGNYTFSPSTPIRINAGQQYIVNVYADIKSAAADQSTSLNPVIKFGSVTARGVSTGSDASLDPTDFALQAAYISAKGNLTVTLDTDSPIAQQLVMGATDQVLAKFKLAADASENINISKIVLNDLMTTTGTGTIKNVRLYDGTTQIGQAVNFTTENASSTYGVFDGISLTITKNSNKIITVKVDVNTSTNGATSASTHEVSVYDKYDGTNEPITAVGASSGQSITSANLDIGGTTDAQVRGNQMTAYKTKVTAAFATDTPSGASVGGDDAIVAKINITNASNEASQAATIKELNLAISHTGVSLTANRELRIYKDSITSGNLLKTTTWIGTGTEQFGNTNISDMTDVDVTAGATKLFIITMDTQDAGNDDKLSINVDASDITWSDGTTAGATITACDSLPLTPKNLTY